MFLCRTQFFYYVCCAVARLVMCVYDDHVTLVPNSIFLESLLFDSLPFHVHCHHRSLSLSSMDIYVLTCLRREALHVGLFTRNMCYSLNESFEIQMNCVCTHCCAWAIEFRPQSECTQAMEISHICYSLWCGRKNIFFLWFSHAISRWQSTKYERKYVVKKLFQLKYENFWCTRKIDLYFYWINTCWYCKW